MNKIKVTFGKASDSNVNKQPSLNGKVQNLFGNSSADVKSTVKVSPEKISSLNERSVSSSAAPFGSKSSSEATYISNSTNSTTNVKKDNKILILDPSKDGEAAWLERQSKWKEEDLAPPWMETTGLKKESAGLSGGKSLLANAKNVTIGAPTNFDVVPIEDFGLSLVVGMGYDPSKGTSAGYQPVKRTYFRAGIGAEKEFLLPHEKEQLKMDGENLFGGTEDTSSSDSNE